MPHLYIDQFFNSNRTIYATKKGNEKYVDQINETIKELEFKTSKFLDQIKEDEFKKT